MNAIGYLVPLMKTLYVSTKTELFDFPIYSILEYFGFLISATTSNNFNTKNNPQSLHLLNLYLENVYNHIEQVVQYTPLLMMEFGSFPPHLSSRTMNTSNNPNGLQSLHTWASFLTRFWILLFGFWIIRLQLVHLENMNDIQLRLFRRFSTSG